MMLAASVALLKRKDLERQLKISDLQKERRYRFAKTAEGRSDQVIRRKGGEIYHTRLGYYAQLYTIAHSRRRGE